MRQANHNAKILSLRTLLVLGVGLTVGCARNTSAKPEDKWEIPELQYEDFQLVQETFYEPFSEKFQQVVYDENRTNVTFSVWDERGYNVPDLRKDDFEFQENDVTVNDFELQKISQSKKVDFVFVVDTTYGMEKMIGRLKDQAEQFQNGLNAAGLDGKFCLVTFADRTESQCDQFGSASDLKNQISKMKMKISLDSDENALRGLMDAVNTSPWRSDANRVLILVTNERFHYAPNNKGQAGSYAPTFEDAFQFLKRSGASVFVIGKPGTKGYDLPFDTGVSLPQVTSLGRFHNFQPLESAPNKLSEFFFDVVHSIPDQYQVRYTVDDQVGLNPEYPLARRKFKVILKPQGWAVADLIPSTNLPNGRGAYVTKWRLSRTPRSLQKNLKILINGNPYSHFARIHAGHLEMDVAAPAGSEIQVFYDLDRFQDQMATEILVLPTNIDFTRFVVRANGVNLGLDTLRLSQNSQGNYLLNPGLLTADFEDPYNIVGLKKLRLEVYGRRRIEQSW